MLRDGQGHTAGNNNSYHLLVIFHVSSILLGVLHASFPILPINLQHVIQKDSTPAVSIATQNCWRELWID